MEKKETRNLSSTRFSWIGYPDDLGVKNVGGRSGAAAGPDAFQTCFSRLKGKQNLFNFQTGQVRVEMTHDLGMNHERAYQETRNLLARSQGKNDSFLAVGGGHDYAYPLIKAIRDENPKKRIACLNIDAHFDLRDYSVQMGSGSPFRRLIEEGVLAPSRLVEFGIQSHCNGPELWDYAKVKKIKTLPFEGLRHGKAVIQFKKALQALKKTSDLIVLSLDLDAISFAYCPAVSAPQAEGFTASEIFEMLEIAGSDKKVTTLGIFELAPPLEAGDLSARLAAQAAWHFLKSKFK